MTNTNLRLALAKVTKMANQTEFSYAINAARRSEKRRVHNFVRLLDYMICHALHMLLVGSIEDMRLALTPTLPATPGPAGGSDAADTAITAASASAASTVAVGIAADDLSMRPGTASGEAAAAAWGGPLLVLTVRMSPETDELLFDPEPQRLLDHMMKVQGLRGWGGRGEGRSGWRPAPAEAGLACSPKMAGRGEGVGGDHSCICRWS